MADTADTFDVWGKPPNSVTDFLTLAQQKALKQYVDGVVSKCYRVAYDNGHDEGLAAVISLANARLKKRMQIL